MRPLLAALTVLVLVLLAPATALGHAVLLEATPPPDSTLETSPAEVVLRFNEPVQVLDPATDVDVVDERGAPAQSGPAVVGPADARLIRVPLRPGLPDGTYTTRFRIIGADSHVIGGAFVFGVGVEDLADPWLAGAAGERGPSETGGWMVSARFAELAGLAGLLGLVCARILVWGGTWRRHAIPAGGERDAALAWGRDLYWTAFGLAALVAILAEGWVLVTRSAATLGTSVPAALADPAGVSRVLSDTRFGELLQVRAALLLVVFAIAAWQFLGEHGAGSIPTPAGAAGRLVPALVMAVLVAAAIGVVSDQGHASQAPAPLLQVTFETVHVGAVGIWLAGLAWAAWAAVRLPRIAPREGAPFAGRVLGRYSRVAIWLVVVVVATGIVRTAGELSAPEQLWETAYGRSVLAKLILLAAIVGLALWSRRIVTAIERRRRPGRRAVGLIPPRAAVQLTLALVVVLIASLLGGQIPGRI